MKSSSLTAGRQVQQLDDAGGLPRRKLAAGRRECQVGDCGTIPPDVSDELTRPRIPEVQTTALVGRGDEPAIGGIGGADSALVGNRLDQFAASLHVPDADHAVMTGRDQLFPAREQMTAGHPILRPGQDGLGQGR